MQETILVTPGYTYLLSPYKLLECNINIKKYTKNCGDSLRLRRSILTELKSIEYPYIAKNNIKHKKDECKNRSFSREAYENIKRELQNKSIVTRVRRNSI